MVSLPCNVRMRGSMNEAHVQTVPLAQLLLSRNAHFGEHRLCDIGRVLSSNRYSKYLPPLPRVKQAPAPTFIHGAGIRRSPVTSPEMRRLGFEVVWSRRHVEL